VEGLVEQLSGAHQQLKVTNERAKTYYNSLAYSTGFQAIYSTVQVGPEESRLKCSHPKKIFVTGTKEETRWWYLRQTSTASAVYSGRSSLMELCHGNMEQYYIALHV
jgi:hypothetical protein